MKKENLINNIQYVIYTAALFAISITCIYFAMMATTLK